MLSSSTLAEADLILDFLREQGLTAAAILNTHGHADHIGGNAALKDAFMAPLVIGIGNAHMLSDTNANLVASIRFADYQPGGRPDGSRRGYGGGGGTAV